jgi:hypothetical protein
MKSQIIESKAGSNTEPEQGKLYVEAGALLGFETILLCTDEDTFVVVHSGTFVEGYIMDTNSVVNPVPWQGTLQLTQD